MSTITKDQFEALPDFLKTNFKADGENYIFQTEDVEGLKKSKQQILEEKKNLQAQADEMKKRLEEIDANKSAEETELMKKRGEFEQLEKKLREKLAETETKATEREQSLLNNFKTERLKNELTQRGVLADRAKYALADIAEQVELVSDENGFSLKVKNGIGDAKEFDALIDGMKQSSPFFFAASNASGSGASGSNGNGGGTGGKKRSEMSMADKNAYIAEHGQEKYLSLPN